MDQQERTGQHQTSLVRSPGVSTRLRKRLLREVNRRMRTRMSGGGVVAGRQNLPATRFGSLFQIGHQILAKTPEQTGMPFGGNLTARTQDPLTRKNGKEAQTD